MSVVVVVLLFLQTRISAVAGICTAGVASIADRRRAGRTGRRFTSAALLGLRHRILVLRFAIDVVDVVRPVCGIVDLLPSVRQFVFGAFLQRFLLDLGKSRVQPLRRPSIVTSNKIKELISNLHSEMEDDNLLDKVDFASFRVGLFPVLRKRTQFGFRQAAHGPAAVFSITGDRHVVVARIPRLVVQNGIGAVWIAVVLCGGHRFNIRPVSSTFTLRARVRSGQQKLQRRLDLLLKVVLL